MAAPALSPRNATRFLLLAVTWVLALIVDSAVAAPDSTRLSTAERVQAMYEAYKLEDFPDLPDLSGREARSLADSVDVVILDVRRRDEWEISVIPGAVDLEHFAPLDADELDGPVLVYCTIGYRSARVVRDLRERGFDARNLRGGILGWIHAGGEIFEPGTGLPTRRVHVYGRRWNLLPPDWEGIW